MHTRLITSLVVLALGFFSEIHAARIRIRDDSSSYDSSPDSSPDSSSYTTSNSSYYNVSDPSILDLLQQVSITNLEQYIESNSTSTTSRKKRRGDKCNVNKATVRREWGDLSLSARKAYTDAVLCLMSQPSQSDPDAVPGARNRYDDFVAVHINQTLSIHGTTNFLSWHRYFSWAFEQALKNECGYRGTLPYWNWGKYASDPERSPVFDGSAYSMSGNGAYVPDRAGLNLLGGPIYIPPQNGGGCVTSGPFKDMVVNLGPVVPVLEGVPFNPLFNGLGYNPRCLKRDIGNYVSTRWTKTTDIASLILLNNNIGSFQSVMQGDFPNGKLGVHTGGHMTIAGDPGGDFFTSPADPAFFLHHSMIDYTWWIWQNLAPKQRTYAVGGTITINNYPPSRDGTLDDTINLGVIAPNDITLRELMSTVDGPFCYIYV